MDIEQKKTAVTAMISGANNRFSHFTPLERGSISSASASTEEIEYSSDTTALSSLEKQHQALHSSIERLDNSIKHYGLMYNIKWKIWSVITSLVSVQTVTYSTAGTASFLGQIASSSDKPNIALQNVNTSLTTSVNALTFGVQLYLSCKSLVTWKRAAKLGKELQNTPPLYERQKFAESRQIKKNILEEISVFISLNPELLRKTFAKNKQMKKMLADLEKQKHIFAPIPHLRKANTLEPEQISHLKNQAIVTEIANSLFDYLIHDSEKWKNLQKAVKKEGSEARGHFTRITQAGTSYKKIQEDIDKLQKHKSAPALEKTSFSNAIDERAGVLDKIIGLLQKASTSQEGKKKLVSLGLSTPTSLTKQEWETFIFSNRDGLKSMAAKAQDSYLQGLLCTIHLDLDRLQAIASSEGLMKSALEKQKQKAEEGIRYFQEKIELILHAHEIYNILSSSSPNKEKQLKDLLPNIAKSFPHEIGESSLNEFVDNLFTDYKTGFRLKELIGYKIQGYDLRVIQERLDYLAKTLNVPLFEKELSLSKKDKENLEKLKLAIEGDCATPEQISEFSEHLAKRAFGHKTALEQSVKNGLQALAIQKLGYARDLEEGGRFTKAGALFARGVYLFSSLATCICLPLMATGVLTIPAAALLIFSKILYLITTISLGGGIAYWRKNAPHTFKQYQKDLLSSSLENLKWIKDCIKRSFGYDLQHPTQFDLLSQKKKLLTQQRKLLVLQAALIDLDKKRLQGQEIVTRTSIFGRPSHFDLEKKHIIKQRELSEAHGTFEKIERTLNRWEALYALQYSKPISKIQAARIKDMSEAKKKNLKGHFAEPIKLAFSSIFEENANNNLASQTLSLSDAIANIFLEKTLPTDLELLFEAMGISVDDIQVQVETERQKKTSQDTGKVEERVKFEVEQALGLFFGGALEQITHTDQLGLEIFNRALTE